MNIGDLTVKIGADIADLSAKMEMASTSVLQFGALAGVGAGVAQAGLEVVSKAFESLLDVIPEATEHAAEFAHSIEEVSAKTGLSDQFIMALTPALNQVNLSAGDLSMGFRRLSMDIVAAQNPASKQAEMFRELGLSANQLTDPGQALSLIADRLSQLPDGFEKTRLATELMSRTGINLIPILDQGAEGFAESGRKAQEMGLLLSETAMTALKSLHDSYKDAETASDSFSTHLGIAFAPIIEQFNKLKISGVEMAIGWVDTVGEAMRTLTARAQGLWGFLREQASLPLSAGLDGLVEAWKKWDDQTSKVVEEIRSQTVAIVDQGNVFTQADAHIAAYQARLQAMGDAQEQIGRKLLNTAIAARQADEAQYGTKSMQKAIQLSGQFWEAITPAQMAEQLEKGNAIVEASMLARATAINEYGKAAVETAERLNALFGEGTTTPAQAQGQEQLGEQALQAFQQQKAINAMRLEDEVQTDHAVLAVQDQLYRNEMGFIGAAEAARRVANTALESEQAQQRANLKLQLDSGAIDYQSYETRLEALEEQGTAKRMQIISQYPTFLEKQLGDLVNANTFNMAQISNTFTSNIAKMIVEGGKLDAMWKQLQTSLVQSALNAGVQMLANAALNFLKETELATTMEQAKTAIAEAMGIERVGAQKAEQEAGVANAEAALSQMGAVAEASSAIMEAVTNEIAAVFAAIGAALGASVVGAPLAPAFEEAAGAVEAAGTGAVLATQGTIDGAISAAEGVIGGTGVPAMAAGGIVTGPTLALVGEAGPEAVIPLSHMGNMNGGGPVDFHFTLEMDRQTLTDIVLKELPRRVRLKGLTR